MAVLIGVTGCGWRLLSVCDGATNNKIAPNSRSGAAQENTFNSKIPKILARTTIPVQSNSRAGIRISLGREGSEHRLQLWEHQMCLRRFYRKNTTLLRTSKTVRNSRKSQPNLSVS